MEMGIKIERYRKKKTLTEEFDDVDVVFAAIRLKTFN